jgi:kumamolisin
VASGDGGSLGWNNTTQAGKFPGHLTRPTWPTRPATPWVTSCGGTTLSLTTTGAVDQEWVWNDMANNTDGTPGATGGGISVYFAQPPWQVGVVSQLGLNPGNTGSGRGVPDVAGNASLNSGYSLSLSGTTNGPLSGPFYGTSAVAPLYAGLVAMINARLGYQIGF